MPTYDFAFDGSKIMYALGKFLHLLFERRV